jgi:hypothetical protein
MSLVLPHLQYRVLTFLASVMLFCAPMRGCSPVFGAEQTEDGSGSAQAHAAPEANAAQASHAANQTHPTLLVYSQHPLPEDLWEALFTALRANLPEAVSLVPARDADPQFVRGDDPANGKLSGQAITVYLMGDCRPPVEHAGFPQGKALGWVSKVNGRIVPIIHVECTQVGEAIAGRTQWMKRDERNAAMSEAMARVVLHEWVHVATQSAAHGSEGVTRAGFGVEDLLSGGESGNGSVGGKNRAKVAQRASSACLSVPSAAGRGY